MANSKTPHWRRFPATSTVAYYDPFSQHIELCDVDSKELISAFDYKKDVHKTIKVLPILFHEFRHWFDHTTTLWGIRRLAEATNAINAWTNQDAKELWRINRYARNVNRDFAADYFTTVNDTVAPKDAANQWIAELSCGVGFGQEGKTNESDPIFFTRYLWNDNRLACRVPFSISALLETNAMHTEISSNLFFTSLLDNIDEKIEMDRIEKLYTNSLYSPELAVYSTAVHAVANKMNLRSGHLAYPLASALSAYCLNFPEQDFDNLRIPEELEPFGERNAAAKARLDRGFLYLALSHFGDKKLVGSPKDWVLDAAQKANLPDLEILKERVASEREAIAKEVSNGLAKDRFEETLKIGQEMSELVGTFPDPKTILSSMHKLVIPPIICNDTEVHLLLRAKDFWSRKKIEEWSGNCSTWSRTFTEFLSACLR